MPTASHAPRGVRPVDAATLIPLRRHGRTLEVLMGRRARRHSFVPDMYVFPGGRVDAADYDARVLSGLRPSVHERLQAAANARRARALAVAAVRETWEETGIAIGAVREGRLHPALDRLEFILRAITPAQSPIRFHARFFVAQVSDDDGEPRTNGELLDLAWRPVAECLKLPLVDVTEFILTHLDRYLEPGAGPAPLFCFRNGRVLLRG
jgi:8-oxo-dGTP pyrophosphatase MutT (NUDIX family)